MITFLACLTLLFGCTEDDRDLGFLNSIPPPGDIALNVVLLQDNSGTVTLTPSGNSVSSFTLAFGDGSEPITLLPGESVVHTYPEGSYEAVVTAVNGNGGTATFTQTVVVAFAPPENLQVTITPVTDDPFSITLSAEADLAVGFLVYFGEEPNEEPEPLMVGGTITHTYSAVGIYEVRVVALSGGAETTEVTVTVKITNPIELPIDFESPTIDYAFADFGGALSAVVANPAATGINTSATVAEFIKQDGAEVFAGTTLQLGSPIDFSTFQALKLKSHSPVAGITVKLKIENADDSSISAEIDATTTVADQWEELTFDFSNADLSQDYSKIIVFFNFGNPGVGLTYYYDDIRQTTAPSTALELPITFESTAIPYDFVSFGGATAFVADNPNSSGINTSPKVAEFFKEPGAEVFAGTFLELTDPIDFSTSQVLTLKSLSPQAGITVKLKIENADDGAISSEIDAITTVADQWEELSFDFSNADLSQEYSKVVVFFDFGNPGTGTTYYYDDVQLDNNGAGGVTLPVTFEDTALTYEILGFEGADSEIESNPFPTGMNTSATVVKTIKTNGAQFFAGTIVFLDQPVDFSATERIKIKTYSPKANIPVRLKLETEDGGQFVELDANTTVADQWEELTYDFSGMNTAPQFTKVVVFFEFIVNLPGDGTTYYFDDIQLDN